MTERGRLRVFLNNLVVNEYEMRHESEKNFMQSSKLQQQMTEAKMNSSVKCMHKLLKKKQKATS